MELDVGARVVCTDGDAGEVVAVVADPAARTLTHLGVEPRHQPGLARLVGVELVTSSRPGLVRLGCTLAAFRALPDFRDVDFIPYVPDTGDAAATLAYPYLAMPDRMVPVLVDRVPAGEIEVRRGDPVHARDGSIGRVEGLVVDRERHITYVVLQEGHLWGRKEVAIPIGAVEGVDEAGIHVGLSKSAIAALPELEAAWTERLAAT